MKKDFWDNFAEALCLDREKKPVGKGWATANELAERFKTNPRLMGRRLNQGRKKGLLDYFNGCYYKNGKLRRATWYREKQA